MNYPMVLIFPSYASVRNVIRWSSVHRGSALVMASGHTVSCCCVSFEKPAGKSGSPAGQRKSKCSRLLCGCCHQPVYPSIPPKLWASVFQGPRGPEFQAFCSCQMLFLPGLSSETPSPSNETTDKRTSENLWTEGTSSSLL